MRRALATVVTVALCLWGLGAQAAIVVDTVPIANAGNEGEASGTGAGGYGPNRTCGAVGYEYNMGKFEVTCAQYTDFLNAVGRTDTYYLYNEQMWSSGGGCKIQQSGSPGSYSYQVAADWANRPVNSVGWGDAARFANWMHNGQPIGLQGPGTTETGSYTLNGATDNAGLLAATRSPGATWVIPNEDEWYKAAYHKNDGVTAHYWDYPTGSNDVPNNGNPGGDTGNSANFFDGDQSLGYPYFRTTVGWFSQSESPYGTYDQAGNVDEWLEANLDSQNRVLRGGNYMDAAIYGMFAASRGGAFPAAEGTDYGFRLALVPEPGALALLALGALAAVRRR